MTPKTNENKVTWYMPAHGFTHILVYYGQELLMPHTDTTNYYVLASIFLF